MSEAQKAGIPTSEALEMLLQMDTSEIGSAVVAAPANRPLHSQALGSHTLPAAPEQATR